MSAQPKARYDCWGNKYDNNMIEKYSYVLVELTYKLANPTKKHNIFCDLMLQNATKEEASPKTSTKERS